MTKDNKTRASLDADDKVIGLHSRQNETSPVAKTPAVQQSQDEQDANRRRLCETWQRLKRGDLGPRRPLAGLVKAEAEIQIRSEALAALATPPQGPSDRELLAHQLSRVVNTQHVSRHVAPKLRRDAIRQHTALGAADPIDSILDRHIVAMSLGALDNQALAVQTGNLKAVEIYLRHAEKMTQIFAQLVDLRDRRRGPRQSFVGNVTVGPGGQAILANNIETRQREEQQEKKNAAIKADTRRRRAKS